jgi:nitrate/nitrite-specific signal transduction histidine kinase
MTIRDDGVGFDKKFLDTQPITHFGMQIMRERSKAIGAQVEIDSVPGTGTRVSIIVPMAEAK